MEQNWTKEPWRVRLPDPDTLRSAKVLGPPHPDGSDWAALCEISHHHAADAQRIVACVNACAGIPTEALEKGVVHAMVVIIEELHDNISGDWNLGKAAGCGEVASQIAALLKAD
jgi:hypothetical protein